MTDWLTPADPEPPRRTFVEDPSGFRWWRTDSDGIDNTSANWCSVEHGCASGSGFHDHESWTKVAGNYGPVRVVEGTVSDFYGFLEQYGLTHLRDLIKKQGVTATMEMIAALASAWSCPGSTSSASARAAATAATRLERAPSERPSCTAYRTSTSSNWARWTMSELASRPAPLDDPAYVPVHPPVGGEIPDVVTKWGPRSQVRWFRRFGGELGARRDWDSFYCHSEHHVGLCCTSCWEEGDLGVSGIGDYCCCQDGRLRQ